jgi:hypothetical protein
MILTRFAFVLFGNLLVCGSVFAQLPAAYASPEGKYQIAFPGAPKHTVQTTKTELGELKVFISTFVGKDGTVFLLSYTDMPAKAVRAENHATLFEGVKEIKGSKGEIVSEKSLEFGAEKLPGRELIVDKGKQRIRFRAILRENRLYQLAVIGTAEGVAAKGADAFFDSLEITK